MLKKRLIPVLLLQNGMLVRSQGFCLHQIIGNPLHEVDRFNDWNVDELVYLDISRAGSFDSGRPDAKSTGFQNKLDILTRVSKSCFMPLTWGGGIRSVDDAASVFKNGADKIAINSQAFRTPQLISEIAARYGNQAVVVSIDVKRSTSGGYEVYIDGGRTATGRDPTDWASEVEQKGAGEVLLQSIDRDGTGKGYDLDLIASVAQRISLPVVALGGVGQFEDYAKATRAGAAAAAAANIWHFKELADRTGKRALVKAGVDVRM